MVFQRNLQHFVVLIFAINREIFALNSIQIRPDGRSELRIQISALESFAKFPYLVASAPDEEMIRLKAPRSATDLAEAAGYKLESYKTTTADGYNLLIHRLRSGRQPEDDYYEPNVKRPVVLLQHGIVQSSADWLINESGKSLAMILVDSGYDVWLGNSRGNKYSNSHVNYDEETMEYYDFTFHEMGVRDIPATIDMILKETNQTALSYVGNSLGATIFFTAISSKPEYANKINFMAALSPQVFLSHTKTPIKLLAPHLPEIKEAAVRLGVMRINPETLPLLINTQLGRLCFWRRLSRALCNSIYQMLEEFGLSRIDESHLDNLWKYIPTTTSARTCIHLLQLMNNPDMRFDEYDYGPDGNTQMYGSPAPPGYELMNVRVPVAVFTGREEIFSTAEDVEALIKSLPIVVKHVEVDSSFRLHTDFTHDRKAVDQVFKPILAYLNYFNSVNNATLPQYFHNYNQILH